MIYPPERIAEVCQLGPVKASQLLERGRAGDFQAIADWTVRAAYTKMIRAGAAPAEALRDTREIMAVIDLKTVISP